jgi:hypothetical protein
MRHILVFAVSLLVPAAVSAQVTTLPFAPSTTPAPPRGHAAPDWTLGISAGAGTTWDDESDIGSGALAGLRAARRIAGQTWLDGGVSWLRNERAGVLQSSGRTIFAEATLLQRFGHGRVRPFVLGGVTLARYAGTTTFVPEQLVTRTRSRDLGVTAGSGFTVRAGRRYALGPEVRLTILRAGSDAAPAFSIWGGLRFEGGF